jgi:hypothetical protein
MPSPAMAAPRIRLGEKVSFLTRCLLLPNPNMMLPPVSKSVAAVRDNLKVGEIAGPAVMASTVESRD